VWNDRCFQYNDGLRGRKGQDIEQRLSQLDKKSTCDKGNPHSVLTTTQLIDSILNANEKGKIKIRKIEDNTGRECLRYKYI